MEKRREILKRFLNFIQSVGSGIKMNENTDFLDLVLKSTTTWKFNDKND